MNKKMAQLKAELSAAAEKWTEAHKQLNEAHWQARHDKYKRAVGKVYQLYGSVVVITAVNDGDVEYIDVTLGRSDAGRCGDFFETAKRANKKAAVDSVHDLNKKLELGKAALAVIK